MEKVTRGPEIIFRRGRIWRDHTVFQVLKERGGGDQSSPTEFKGRTIENCQVTVDEGGGGGRGRVFL